ncbi:restriction endonuclease subunit S [Micromonospora antibiotica]|uniref:Restriction endonuclease subunit S n=1 Tax=Micromonospora antibiotica TaxID=2807623 RepID=A0ABS3V102_9ACTN|nr:restriction endonuclease subunit S [Micromonospora antibiotica]MBO4159284.1 restriction endonuclease subunit S [Micromonospora antibiotica]
MSAWQKARLSDCCEIVSGATPKTGVEEYWDGEIPWATPKDLSVLRGTYIHDTPRKITASGLRSCAASVLPVGSVLLSSRAPIGHVAINTIPMATNQGFKSLVPDVRAVEAKYLYWWLKANRPYLESLGNGATFKEISKGIVSQVEIPLPPLEEQRRIAEALDRADDLRAKRREALARLDDLTRSIFLDMFGDPARNNKGLPLTPLGKLGQWRSGGTPPRSAEEYFEGEIPWFSSGELGNMYVSQSNEQVSLKALAETSAKKVLRGSIMIGMYDTAALKTSIAAVDCSCNQAIAFASLDSEMADPVYVYFALRVGRDHFRRLQRGARQKNLNVGMVREMALPLPPLADQRQFRERIAAAEKLDVAHQASLTELDALFASLQDRAFRGLL